MVYKSELGRDREDLKRCKIFRIEMIYNKKFITLNNKLTQAD